MNSSNLVGVNFDDIVVKNEGNGQDPLLAAGLHPAVVTSIVEGHTDNGNPFVDYYFAITGGVNQGANIRSREWPQSTSEAGQEIYNKKLKALMTIANIPKIENLAQLCGHQMLINNKPRPRKDDASQMQNSINFYKSYDPNAKLASAAGMSVGGAPAPAPAPAPTVVQQPAAQPLPQPAPQQAQPLPQPQPQQVVGQQQVMQPQGVVVQQQPVVQQQAVVQPQPVQQQGDYNDAIPPMGQQQAF